jgi:hypothetical protein
MTKNGQAKRRNLLRDMEYYGCGVTPSPLELLRSAKLDDWRVDVLRRGKEFVMVVRGTVSRHPEIPDGEDIGTSALRWFDRHHRFIRTVNSLYALGQAAGAEGTP